LSGPWLITEAALGLVTASPNLHTLRLHCPLREQAAVALLSKLQVVDLSETDLVDPAPLRHASTLVLRGCTKIADVSQLGAVQKLDLSGCSRVVDVSALGDVRTLNLSRTSVRDAGMLGKCQRLALAGTLVDTVSALGRVHHLDLRGTRVVDISALGGVDELLLARCFRIADFGALRTQVSVPFPPTRVPP
jgi:hypothetical protein